MSSFAAYLRTGSLAVATYDYLQTLPFELRVVVETFKTRRLSLSSGLFFAIRYISIVVLTLSNYGFFSTSFTEAACRRYFLLPGAFKVLQTCVSQAILGIRAYNLSRKSTLIGTILLTGYLICCTLQWISTLYERTMSYKPDIGNCASKSPAESALGGWVHYAVALVYDFATSMVCVWYLLKLRPLTSSVMSRVSRMMLVDGLWYFLALALVNVINLIFYRRPDIGPPSASTQSEVELQTAAASLGYAMTWIMSSKLLVHLRDASTELKDDSLPNGAVTVTHQLSSARDISRALRSQFKSKSGGRFELTVPDFEASIGEIEDVDVHVQIERSVRMEPQLSTRVYELEDYSRSRQ
ncbi:hypothetical protein HMN09_01034400 [Mycena chlorophos]|uniref:Uncharacterized protein n=1 Tax=Mycena chlorophos TaxID=658473 RepID=A0A8H6SEL1_MYCCL|nr:hypothetical protein HMN09_01034400 [Mycena chlorophos]